MPTYSYKCPICGLIRVHWRNVADRDKLPLCICHKTRVLMERLPDAPSVCPQGLSK